MVLILNLMIKKELKNQQEGLKIIVVESKIEKLELSKCDLKADNMNGFKNWF